MVDHYGTKEIKSPDPVLPTQDMAANIQEFEGVLKETGQNNPVGDAEQSLVLLTRAQTSREEGDQALQVLKAKYGVQ